MMRIFLCPECGQSRIVSRALNAECFRCKQEMVLCHTRYSQWVELSQDEREQLINDYLTRQK